ncbi:hypothetical protein OXIME_001584 [Oxyplasma meridianum]|uniref:Uncharacterized protein n=1 Tax=Oxyplasma meridianum TaxID=3073602 RepID=A0AAX4NHQ3_9ARCH
MVSSSANVTSNYETVTASPPSISYGQQAYGMTLANDIMNLQHLILSSYNLHKDSSAPNLTSGAFSLNYGGGYLENTGIYTIPMHS